MLFPELSGPPVLPEILQTIGINPGRIIKSRPGSLSGEAFFPCVLDRFSGVKTPAGTTQLS